MRGRVRLWVWITIVIVGLGLIVFFISPILFAGVTYPLPEKHRASVAKWSQEYKISPNFLAALIMTESTWKENARSSAGAVGLTQFIPSTAVAVAKRLGVSPFTPTDLTTNPDMAIRFGAHYISNGISRYSGNTQKALIAYNGGGGAVMAFERGTPVRGTVGYADKILRVEKAYDAVYGQWWKDPSKFSSAGEPAEFNVKPKVNIDNLAEVRVIDFWKTLLSSPVSDQKADEATGGLNDLWKAFISP